MFGLKITQVSEAEKEKKKKKKRTEERKESGDENIFSFNFPSIFFSFPSILEIKGEKKNYYLPLNSLFFPKLIQTKHINYVCPQAKIRNCDK